jgi:hypothetical protein
MKQESRRPAEAAASRVHQSDDTGSLTPNPRGAQAIVAVETDPIGRLRPWESPATLTLRRRLNNAAVLSASRASSAQSPHARVVFWIVNEAAAAWTFASATDAQMLEVLHGLNVLKCGADALERNASGA